MSLDQGRRRRAAALIVRVAKAYGDGAEEAHSPSEIVVTVPVAAAGLAVTLLGGAPQGLRVGVWAATSVPGRAPHASMTRVVPTRP
ncbi:hypothetical protein E4K10_00030 [Streptomyces sp. T1317-0309]|nr:hypothetical protein E4K10_00030 [Streptomyces sp. T1317-0309]